MRDEFRLHDLLSFWSFRRVARLLVCLRLWDLIVANSEIESFITRQCHENSIHVVCLVVEFRRLFFIKIFIVNSRLISHCHVMSRQWPKTKPLTSIRTSDLTVQSFFTRDSLLRTSRINSTRIVVSLYTSWLSLYAFDQRSLITRSYISLTILIRLNL